MPNCTGKPGIKRVCLTDFRLMNCMHLINLLLWHPCGVRWLPYKLDVKDSSLRLDSNFVYTKFVLHKTHYSVGDVCLHSPVLNKEYINWTKFITPLIPE